MSKKMLLYIVNPISGNGKKANIICDIEKYTDTNTFDFEIKKTEYAGHAAEIAKAAAEIGIEAIVAVGGDGTINEVARSIVGTPSALGIIPCGSGNGLARHLQIPMNSVNAIKIINQNVVHCLDYGLINNHPFFCTCGVGFDAVISKRFAESGRRGPITYIENVLRESLSYKPEIYTIEDLSPTSSDNQPHIYQAFLIACANASQYGNNAYIAPQASMKDGLMDIIIIEPFSALEAPQIAVQLFNKSLLKNSHIKMFQSSHIRISRTSEGAAHCDGDPLSMSNTIDVKLVPQQFNIIVNPEAHTPKKKLFQLLMEDVDEWWVSQQRVLRKQQVGIKRLNRNILNKLKKL